MSAGDGRNQEVEENIWNWIWGIQGEEWVLEKGGGEEAEVRFLCRNGGDSLEHSWGSAHLRQSHQQIGTAFQYLKGISRKAGEGLFARASSDRTRENGLR